MTTEDVTKHPWAPLAASALAYCVVTVVLGRDVLLHLSTTVVHDAGDPLLTAAILHWNAWSLPLSHAWWQFPIFYPTADTLAFSEHLLGLSVIATPVAWLTRDPLAAANLATLLTYPLSGIATFLLVRRVTGSAAGGFVAGLAFAFSPYRVSQLSHVQMLAACWAPLALVGLHAFLDTGRRRWLVLYGVAWLLQVTANGYSLFFFSLFVGLWALWFVVRPRRWHALRAMAVATLCAAVPLVPVLYTYLTVHARHGFARSVVDLQAFSADIAAVLCAPADLTWWGWVRVACAPEGEIFPGVVVSGLVVVAAVTLLWRPPADSGPRSRWRWAHLVQVPALVVIAVTAAAMASFLAVGPWRLAVGALRVSVTSTAKPVMLLLLASIVVVLTSRGAIEAVRRSSATGFYLWAAVVTWALALGPTVTLMGDLKGIPGPFRLLMLLPGVDSLRVPARFWLMTTLCLAVVAGSAVAELVARRRRTAAAVLVGLLSVGVLSDGWTGGIQAVPAPAPIPDGALARGGVVLSLPAGNFQDFAPEYLAVVGGWQSVNGYSGYEPRYYEAVRQGVRFEADSVFEPFRRRHDLHVVVASDETRLRALVERQAGVVQTGASGGVLQYRLPKRGGTAPAVSGVRRRVVRVESSCLAVAAPAAVDGDMATRWHCGPQAGHETFTLDLGEVTGVGAIKYGLGAFFKDFPRDLVVETSRDRLSWEPARRGDVIAETIEAGLAAPLRPVLALPFPPRPARYVRLTQVGKDDGADWSIAELEIWSGGGQTGADTY